MWQESEAVEPIVDGGLVRRALVRRKPADGAKPATSTKPVDSEIVSVRARYLVVCGIPDEVAEAMFRFSWRILEPYGCARTGS